MFLKKFPLISLITLALLTLKGISILDPDFGWHLRIGQLIIHSGIPTTDPFSYTMPSYPFVDHEWLTNVFLATLYPLIGYSGLALLFAGIACLSLRIALGKLKGLSLIIYILTALVLVRFTGVRPQIITWLFVAGVFKLLNDPKLWKKYRFFLPGLFVLWTNLHGGFPVGLVILLILHLLSWIKQRSVNWIDLNIIAASIVGTFINPYGDRIWWEVWQQFSDSPLHYRIGEWVPYLFSFHLPSLFLVAISGSFFIKYFKKHSTAVNVLFLVLLIGGLSTSRHFPFWVLVSLPILIQDLKFFQSDISTIKLAKQRINRVTRVFVWSIGALFILESVWLGLSFAGINKSVIYPQKALGYLKKLPQGQIFTDYDWGGYLVWQLPERKVFIDGRMPSWRRSVAPSKESTNAFNDYLEIVDQLNYQKYFDKYQITTILWSNPDSSPKDIFELIRERTLGANLRSKDRFLDALQKSGWKEVYSDKVAVIYQL